MGTFRQQPYADAAWAVANHGFVEREHGEVGEGDGWMGLVTVSPTVLLNLGENALATLLREQSGDVDTLVWIAQGEDGQVRTVLYATSPYKWRIMEQQFEVAVKARNLRADRLAMRVAVADVTHHANEAHGGIIDGDCPRCIELMGEAGVALLRTAEHCPVCGQPDNCGDCNHRPAVVE